MGAVLLVLVVALGATVAADRIKRGRRGRVISVTWNRPDRRSLYSRVLRAEALEQARRFGAANKGR